MKQHKFSQQVMGVILGGILIVGCATSATSEPTMQPTIEPTIEPTEGAPIGATVELLYQGEGFVEMYDKPSPSATVIATISADTEAECIVVSGPITVEDVTFWELDCFYEDPTPLGDFNMVGWIDVTMLKVID